MYRVELKDADPSAGKREGKVFLMYRVELKVVYFALGLALVYGFLMYRVELKAGVGVPSGESN